VSANSNEESTGENCHWYISVVNAITLYSCTIKLPIYSAWGLLRVCAACPTPRLNQSYELRPPWEQHLRYVLHRVHNGYNTQCTQPTDDPRMKNHTWALNKNDITYKPHDRGKRSLASPTTPRPSLGPLRLLLNGYRVSCTGMKQLGCDVDHSPHLATRIVISAAVHLTPHMWCGQIGCYLVISYSKHFSCR